MSQDQQALGRARGRGRMSSASQAAAAQTGRDRPPMEPGGSAVSREIVSIMVFCIL